MLGLAAGAVSAHRQLVQKSLLSSGNAKLTALLAAHKEASSGGAGGFACSGHGEFFSSEVNSGGLHLVLLGFHPFQMFFLLFSFFFFDSKS